MRWRVNVLRQKVVVPAVIKVFVVKFWRFELKCLQFKEFEL